MHTEIKNKITQLNHLLESAQKPKISWEEMQLISENAFTLQDELMALLDKAEKIEQNIPELQTIFATREVVWDAIAQIAKQEMSVKDKIFKTKKTTASQSRGTVSSQGICCCHQHTHTCCGNTHQEESHPCCCQGEESTKKAKSHCHTSECGNHHSHDACSCHEKSCESLENHHSGECSCKQKK